jgi:hypothetical protein
MKNLIIVEDLNDQYIFEAIIRHSKLQERLEVKPSPELAWLPLPKENNPNKPTALSTALKNLETEFYKESYEKVAIIRDIDNSSQETMFAYINTALK